MTKEYLVVATEMRARRRHEMTGTEGKRNLFICAKPGAIMASNIMMLEAREGANHRNLLKTEIDRDVLCRTKP